MCIHRPAHLGPTPSLAGYLHAGREYQQQTRPPTQSHNHSHNHTPSTSTHLTGPCTLPRPSTILTPNHPHNPPVPYYVTPPATCPPLTIGFTPCLLFPSFLFTRQNPCPNEVEAARRRGENGHAARVPAWPRGVVYAGSRWPHRLESVEVR